MAEYVRMPKADYEAACNALRSRSGKEDLIKSGDLAAEILGISGSSEDVRYVTFVNPATGESFVKPVAVGDDCVDVVTKGLWATPTQESTDQYDYTHYGWGAEPGGAADDTILQNITEDKTVYAIFAAVVRVYTISFYDGNSFLSSQLVGYGDTPQVTDPTKSGYSFDGWEPALAPVTGDTVYTAKWTENITFSGGTWADIARVVEAGDASKYFAVGDSKVVNIDGNDITLRIIGFDHDTLADGSGNTAGMTVFAESALSDTFTVGSWTTLAANMKTTLKAKLPADLQGVIKPVYKKCDDITLLDQEITPTNVSFELFPLSFDELMIRRHSGRYYTDSNWREIFAELGTPYEYFENKYNTTYCGPYVEPWYSTTGTWFRQYFRFAYTTNKAMYHNANLNSTASKWADVDAPTAARKVLFAFCI